MLEQRRVMGATASGESRPPRAQVPRVELVGHLTETSLAASLATLTPILSTSVGPVLIDCRRMTSYDLAARHAFVRWSADTRGHVTRVGIVTENHLWWMVITAMSLASGQDMKGFAEPEQAEAWARR